MQFLKHHLQCACIHDPDPISAYWLFHGSRHTHAHNNSCINSAGTQYNSCKLNLGCVAHVSRLPDGPRRCAVALCLLFAMLPQSFMHIARGSPNKTQMEEHIISVICVSSTLPGRYLPHVPEDVFHTSRIMKLGAKTHCL